MEVGYHQVTMPRVFSNIRAPFSHTVLAFLLLLTLHPSDGGSYAQKKSIYDTKLTSANYNAEIRPLLDQSDVMTVNALFELVSVVEVNDVVQSFKCNGFLGLTWRDEILTWNASDYGGETVISPGIKDIFRPRMVMLNTLGDRDLFEDDNAPINLYSDGSTTWAPGSIFPASCKLDLTKYPFDEQTCEIQMVIMNFGTSELKFVAGDSKVGLTFFTRNGQWDIVDNSVTTPDQFVRDDTMSSIVITFKLKRKPVFLVISIILPIVFLSLLNLLVFAIPVDSGEKISYGITVLLALSVFMSIMSGMLPMSSESMPLVISYIFILMVISVLTVVDSVIIVRLHHMEEREEKSQKAREKFKSTLPKISMLRNAVTPLEKSVQMLQTSKGQSRRESKPLDMEERESKDNSKSTLSTSDLSTLEIRVNRYKMIGKHIDLVSLVVFGVVWIAVTLGFMIAIAA